MAESTTTSNVEMGVEGSGFPVPIDFVAVSEATRTTEVLSIDAGGARFTREKITTFEHSVTTVDGMPTDFDELRLEGDSATDFSPLVDLPLLAEYSPSGTLTSLEVDPAAAAGATVEQNELVDVFAASGVGVDSIAALLPDIPVGQGAEWTVSDADNPAGLSVPRTMRLTLVSLKGDDFTVEMAVEGDAADFLEGQAEPGSVITGDMTLTGTMTGSAANGLDQQLAMATSIDMTIVGGGLEIDVEVTFVAEHVSTPRDS